MRTITAFAFALAMAFAPTSASAYTTRTTSGATCSTSSACHVYCNNGTLAGTMYWNGSRWSDGLRSDADKDVVARQIVAAQGSSCS